MLRTALPAAATPRPTNLPVNFVAFHANLPADLPTINKAPAAAASALSMLASSSPAPPPAPAPNKPAPIKPAFPVFRRALRSKLVSWVSRSSFLRLAVYCNSRSCCFFRCVKYFFWNLRKLDSVTGVVSLFRLNP